MNLLRRIPLQDAIANTPPERLDTKDLSLPSEGRYLHISTWHSADTSSPDYLSELLEKADIFFIEFAGAPTQLQRALQETADGSNSGLRKSLDLLNKRPIKPGLRAYAEATYKQLLGSKVKVVLPDYPRGDKRIEACRNVNASVLKADHINSLNVLKGRDDYLLRNICAALTGFEANRRTLKGPSLEAVSAWGLGHYALADAIKGVAQAQADSTFSSSLLFEEALAQYTTSFPVDDVRGHVANNIAVYQKWLRAPAAN